MAERKSAGENALVTEFSNARDELKNAAAQKKVTAKKDESKDGEINVTEHLLSVADALALHEADLTKGLTDAQVAKKVEQYGLNRLTPPKKTPMWLVFISHLTGFFSLLLWAASILCFVAYGLASQDGSENLILGIVLASVTVVTGIFSFYQDFNANAVMEGFKNFLPESTTVIRNGEISSLPSENLVPGDIIQVKAGDKVPADFKVLSAKSFKVNNSSLTGESIPQRRDIDNTKEIALEATNLAFYGTLCEAGNATGLVIRTADNTVIGKIATLTTSTGTEKTPIAQEIHHFILIISSVAIFLGVTFLAIGFINDNEPEDVVPNLVFAIGIIVANVPEGLLATVTVSLTLTAKRMAKKQVLVKNLEAVETLGSTTVIASDKTGTLTQNIMTVVNLFYSGQIKLAHGESSGSYEKDDATFQRLKLVATLCNNAKFDSAPENMARDIQARDTIGDASESALIKFCEKVGPTIIETQDANRKLAEVPFSSANKFQISVHMQNNDESADRLLVMKGAPERVVDRCDFMLMNGKKVPITDEFMTGYNRDIQALMENGERVLGMAYAELSAKEYPTTYEYITDDLDKANFPPFTGGGKGGGLVFVGLMSLQDPPRPAVPGAVLSCQAAGVKVIMVTGDHPDTAEAISRQVNIITRKTRKALARERGVPIENVHEHDDEIDAVVITGQQLLDLTDAELDYFLDFNEVVFARTSPAQKLRIVKGLQQKQFITRGQPQPLPVSHVVAVTGDGVNDSPALKAANIGVAMGIVGSDVAKDAADMILLNDNFASIVKGVEEGRLIFDNLKKSIAYTLSSNIPEISPFLVFILIQIPLPLPTVLILCIDLGTDMIPAISLAYETKESNIMQKPPRDMRVDRLVTAKLINFSYMQIGMVQAAAGFYTYVVVLMNFGFPAAFLPGKARWFMKAAISAVHQQPFTTGADGAMTDAAGVTMGCTVEGAVFPVMSYCGLDTEPLAECVCAELGPCAFPDSEPLCYDASFSLGALQHAQCAFFIAIIVVQWADLVICKTRTLSVFQQGMTNGTLNFGLFFTTVLGSILCYVPGLPLALGTAPLHFVHWCPAMPFCVMIFLYDEIRKSMIRSTPKGWVDRNTYY